MLNSNTTDIHLISNLLDRSCSQLLWQIWWINSWEHKITQMIIFKDNKRGKQVRIQKVLKMYQYILEFQGQDLKNFRDRLDLKTK